MLHSGGASLVSSIPSALSWRSDLHTLALQSAPDRWTARRPRAHRAPMVASVGRITAGTGYRYLADEVATSKHDYYAGRGEAPGVWAGSGCAELGLNGVVDVSDMDALYGRFVDPRTAGGAEVVLGRKVSARVVNAGTPREHVSEPLAALDVTFSPSKSVSALWAAHPSDDRPPGRPRRPRRRRRRRARLPRGQRRPHPHRRRRPAAHRLERVHHRQVPPPHRPLDRPRSPRRRPPAAHPLRHPQPRPRQRRRVAHRRLQGGLPPRPRRRRALRRRAGTRAHRPAGGRLGHARPGRSVAHARDPRHPRRCPVAMVVAPPPDPRRLRPAARGVPRRQRPQPDPRRGRGDEGPGHRRVTAAEGRWRVRPPHRLARRACGRRAGGDRPLRRRRPVGRDDRRATRRRRSAAATSGRRRARAPAVLVEPNPRLRRGGQAHRRSHSRVDRARDRADRRRVRVPRARRRPALRRARRHSVQLAADPRCRARDHHDRPHPSRLGHRPPT